jgi:hypothetical protein
MPAAASETALRAEAAAGPGAARGAPPAADRVGLRYEGCRFSVRASDVEDLRWLAGFLASGFEEAPAAPADHEVELVVGAEACDALSSEEARDVASLEGFAADSDPILLERIADDGARAVYRDPRHPILFRVERGAARVEVLARERSRSARTALMRVVRELAMARVVRTGGVLVHGAVVATPRGAVVLAGPKRSGKTTLLLALLLAREGAYVANDRCVLREEGGALSVRGLPTIVSLRRDALERFPAARARLAEVRPEVAAAWEAGGASGPGATLEAPRASVSPPELLRLLGAAPAASSAPLRALVFPRIGGGPRALSLRRLEPEEALRRFEAGLFRAGRASPLAEVFVPADASEVAELARASAARLGRRVAAEIPCFECAIGGEGAPSAEECRALVEAIAADPEEVVR